MWLQKTLETIMKEGNKRSSKKLEYTKAIYYINSMAKKQNKKLKKTELSTYHLE